MITHKTICLSGSNVEGISQYNGTFTIKIKGNRRNRKKNYEFYDIELCNVNKWWLMNFLKKAQAAIKEHKDHVVEFGQQFGV